MALITCVNNWGLTDNDCAQYIRHQKKRGYYELIQFVHLDVTREELQEGINEYCIVHAIVYLNDYSEEEIDCCISSYGYNREQLISSYGEEGANDVIAECILEEECLQDSCIIAEFNTEEECINFIEKYVKEH